MGIFLGIFELKVFVTERIVSPLRVWATHVKNRMLWNLFDWVHRPAYMQEGQTPQDPNKDEKSNKEPSRPNSAQDGPPDLDELWNDFNRRLGGLFGGNSKNPSQNNSPSQPSSNASENENVNQNNNNPKKPVDLGNMDPCDFPNGRNIVTNQQCRQAFTNMGKGSGNNKNEYSYINKYDYINNLYLLSLSTIALYIIYRITNK